LIHFYKRVNYRRDYILYNTDFVHNNTNHDEGSIFCF